jgi:hypothetical protein
MRQRFRGTSFLVARAAALELLDVVELHESVIGLKPRHPYE